MKSASCKIFQIGIFCAGLDSLISAAWARALDSLVEQVAPSQSHQSLMRKRGVWKNLWVGSELISFRETRGENEMRNVIVVKLHIHISA